MSLYSLSATVTLPPVQSVLLRTMAGSLTPFVFTLQDATGAAVSLVGKTIAFVAYTDDGVTMVGLWKHDNGSTGGLIIGGANGNVVTVTPGAGDVSASQVLKFELLDSTDNQPLARGILEIGPGRTTVP